MPDTKTDSEIICEFMEPDAPKDGTGGEGLRKFSPKGWWRYSMLSCLWKQPILETCAEVEKLGRLYEVEERLSGSGFGDGDQWRQYLNALSKVIDPRYRCPTAKQVVHASVEQKIHALAKVLRG